jgi:type IV pilus assembly protein PilC
MQAYKYKAVTASGSIVSGVMNANSKDEIVKNLKENNQYPVFIEPKQASRDVNLGDILTKVKIKDIALFCRQLYTMLNAGVTLINCLDILKLQTESKKMRSIIAQVHEDVQKGMSFSEALQEHSKIFPEILINMVRAGEVSGNMDTIMDRMAIHFEKENSIRNKIQGSLAYPMFLGGLTIIVVIFMITFVLPTFVSIFSDSGVQLPGLTRALISFSEFIKNYWYILIGAIVVVLYFTSKFAASEKGKMFFDTAIMKIPVVKGAIQKIYTSRFTRTLSTLMSSGIPLIQALEAVSKVVGNKPVEKAILASIDDVRKGINLSIPIKNMGLFPPMVYYMISIGEESGSIDDLLERTAIFYDDELEESIKKMMSLIEPSMIVFMAFIIGLVVIAIALPMFDMINTVKM